MTREQLEALLQYDNLWSGRSTLVLFIGIVGEYLLPLFFDESKKSRWKRALKAICSGLVVLGIAGEYCCSKRISETSSQLQLLADQRVGEAEKRLATAVDQARYARIDATAAATRAGEAVERASLNEKEAARLNKAAEDERIARVEIEAALQPRRLTPSGQAMVSAKLLLHAGQRVSLWFSVGDVEAQQFANDIAISLYNARWVVFGPASVGLLRESGHLFVPGNDTAETGVEVASTEDAKARSAALDVITQLKSMGFNCNLASKMESSTKRGGSAVWVTVNPRPLGAQGNARLNMHAKH